MNTNQKNFPFQTLRLSIPERQKKYILLTISFVFLIGMGLTTCSHHAEEVKLQVKETDIGLLHEQHLTEIRYYSQTATGHFTHNEKTIVDLREKAMHKKPQETPGYNTALGILEQKNTDLRNKMKAYRYTSEEEWLEFKITFTREVNELHLKLDELANWWK